jgi:hypothetical protein
MVFPSADTWVMLLSPKDISSIVSDILTQCGEEDIEFKIQNSKVKSKKTLKEAIVTKVGGFKRKERNERKEGTQRILIVQYTLRFLASPLRSWRLNSTAEEIFTLKKLN